jgi:DNA-binding NtrC family response regulator
MKRNVLLVADTDSDLIEGVRKASEQTGHGLKMANSARKTLEILGLGFDDVDLAVVEIDSSLHSVAIVEALNGLAAGPPVVAVLGVDEAEAIPILQHHGTSACLTKPFGVEKFATLIKELCAAARVKRSPSCDQWGHVCAQEAPNPRMELTPVPN